MRILCGLLVLLISLCASAGEGDSLLDAIGGVPATPYMLVADVGGRPLGWLRGFIPASELKPLFKQQFGAVCSV